MALTLKEFITLFSNDHACLKEIVARKGGFVCPHCRHTQGYFLKRRPVIICQKCHRHHSPLKGTIFEKSRTSLTSWFYALFVMANTRSGVSAKQLQRELGVTYKTAWRMFKQIRKLMKDDPKEQLQGTVEVDETFVGGRETNSVWRWPPKEKEIVFGMLERGGRAKLRHVANTGKWTLLKEIKENIAPGSQIYSDEAPAYLQLSRHGYQHASVNHKHRFREGDVYTQNIEGLWSQFKRGLTGVYRQVSPKYLQSYADEYAFRYNHRHHPEGIFEVLLGRVVRVGAS